MMITVCLDDCEIPHLVAKQIIGWRLKCWKFGVERTESARGHWIDLRWKRRNEIRFIFMDLNIQMVNGLNLTIIYEIRNAVLRINEIKPLDSV